jgi:hypothetical protein
MHQVAAALVAAAAVVELEEEGDVICTLLPIKGR